MTRKKPTVLNVEPKYKLEGKQTKDSFSESITTLHGTNYFVVKKGKSLVLWTVLMVLNVVTSMWLLMDIKKRFNSDQIVTKIYSDWSLDKVPFPAVSICNFNTVSLNKTKNIQNILLKNNIPQKEINSFLQDLYFLLDFGTGSADVDSHSKVMEVLNDHYYNLDNVMEEVHQNCENLLVYCDFNGRKKNCKDVFGKVKTYAGYCCSFNFHGLEDEFNDPTITHDEDFEYYIDQGGGDEVTSMVATCESGSSSGLRVIFNVEPKDYANWALVPAYGARVLISDPNDYVETTLTYHLLTIGESTDIKVDAMIFQCEDNLRGVDVDKRGCYFHDEVDLIHTNRYSYETCSTECKIKSYKNYCGCVPYKYPVDKSARICEFQDLQCLNYMKAYWETTKTECVPKCYKECRDKTYSVVTDKVPFLAASFPSSVLSGHNVSELAAVRVYYLEPTCNCYMMSLLTDINSFIATYGGIFSLFFGASIITLFELVYLSLTSLAKTIWKSFGNREYCGRS